MIRRVIWDLDNTLMKRDLKAEEAFFQENLSVNQGMTLLSLLSEYEDLFPRFDISMLATFCQEKVDFQVPEAFFRKWFHVHLDYPGTVIDGADEVLSYLYHLGIENVVCTNDTSDIQRVRLKKVGLLPYIQEVYGGEYYFKPHEEAYIRACGSYVPSECMMVGDDFQKDVIGPRSLGISAWHYDPNGRNPEYEYSIKSLRKVKEMF